MKLWGAIIIIAAGVMLGILPLAEMNERIRILSEYNYALNRLKSELSTYGTSIPQSMRNLSLENKRASLFGAVSEHIELYGAMAFSEGWKSYIVKHRGMMGEQAYCAVIDLADVLGRYSIEEQLAAIERALCSISLGQDETKKKLQRVSKLYLGTSISLSLMLVVLLL